jgi:methylated-DNA-[protein]-cysteine S-methyltransferase
MLDFKPVRRRDLSYRYVDSPVGSLLLAGRDEQVHLIAFPSGSRAVSPLDGWSKDDACLREVTFQLEAYFSGALRQFDLDLHFDGTPFQNRVWQELQAIPFGETISYGELAERIGETKLASRAVGAANGANPLPIVIPCHRVIGADRSLTGFGGGLPRKTYLLKHEGVRLKEPAAQMTLF